MAPSASQLSRRRTSGTDFSLRFFALAFLLAINTNANSQTQKPAAEPAQSASKSSVPAPTDKNAAQIELLETKYRFEANGDSRKEVHAHVRINNELGARQFARLHFDFNRGFQSVEIPVVRVTHSSGGTADILPSAITDNPNPAVVDFPAYHDVRVKSVRILGLAPGDLLEYRVITTTTHHPLAPDFWLDHTFDRSGVVSEEIFELDLPTKPQIVPTVNPKTPAVRSVSEGRPLYRWDEKRIAKLVESEKTDPGVPDVSFSTFKSWEPLADRLSQIMIPTEADFLRMRDKAESIVSVNADVDQKAEAIYDFVSKKIRTVDLPLWAAGFHPRNASEILASGYATAEDKFHLFAMLSNTFFGTTRAGFLSGGGQSLAHRPAVPSEFDHLLTMSGYPSINFWMDLNLEVAPFRMLPSDLRAKTAFLVGPAIANHWEVIQAPIPFACSQRVAINAKLDEQGLLDAKAAYALRGDSELLLRVAFHKTEKEKWKDVAQMLALSDGFRGQIVNVTASDPYTTAKPFEVEYEISQPNFVDWSKTTLRIPAILPLPGLPDPPTAAQASSGKAIKLGTPLAIELETTVEIPAGATAQAPIGTTVNRDYATFSSKYSVEGAKLHASRSLHFLLSELPASRAADLNAFLHAVQSDQTQLFTVTPAPQK